MTSSSAVRATTVVSTDPFKGENVLPCIAGPALSEQEIRKLAIVALNEETLDVESFELRPFSVEKLGYLGTHLRLLIRTKTHRRGEQLLSFFVKVVPYDVPLQAEYVTESKVFWQEAKFYREILPELKRDFRGEAWAPECYAVRENFIVFEDLSTRDKRYTLRDKLFDETLVKSGLSALARLHAASLLAERRLGQALDTVYPGAFVERAFSRMGQRRAWYDAGVRLAESIAERLGADVSVVRPAIDEVFLAVRKSRTKSNVASHGDLWANNLMFSEHSETPECLLVDFQLLRYCALAHDPAQFLHLCTDRAFRERHAYPMLGHYYRILCETLEKNEYPGSLPSFEEVRRGYDEQRIGALATAVLYYPTVLQDGKTSARIMDNPHVFEEYYFRDRRQVVAGIMRKDPEYCRRIEEAVTELVEVARIRDELPKPS